MSTRRLSVAARNNGNGNNGDSASASRPRKGGKKSASSASASSSPTAAHAIPELDLGDPAQLPSDSARELCAKLGIAPREFLELTEVFRLVDKDGGGTISKDELELLMQTLGIRASKAELEVMVNEIVQDPSKEEIDLESFITAMSRKVTDSFSYNSLQDAFRHFDDGGYTSPLGRIKTATLFTIMESMGNPERHLKHEDVEDLLSSVAPQVLDSGYLDYETSNNNSEAPALVTNGGKTPVPIATFMRDVVHADLLCLQETKLSELKLTTSPGGTVDPSLVHVDGMDSFHCISTDRKGYSGTAVYAPTGTAIACTMGKEAIMDLEGRAVVLDLGAFVLVNLYCPNGGRNLDYKFTFYERLQAYLTRLIVDEQRQVKNKDSIGFSPRERALLDSLTTAPLHLVDALRHHQKQPPTSTTPTTPTANNQQYTFWDTRTGKRATNQGWRIDYFWVTPGLLPHLVDARILPQVMGSDHCPVTITLSAESTGNEGLRLDLVSSGTRPTLPNATNKLLPRPRSIASFFAPKKRPRSTQEKDFASPESKRARVD
ncbi:Endonuclease/exonuclease/phosphatase [Blastocladiella britannica]|nr:Endonuclease/exonuclease/phosphatase [Blastocladiella britannica]